MFTMNVYQKEEASRVAALSRHIMILIQIPMASTRHGGFNERSYYCRCKEFIPSIICALETCVSLTLAPLSFRLMAAAALQSLEWLNSTWIVEVPARWRRRGR